MARTIQVVFDCHDCRRVGDFWEGVLGYRMDPPPDGFATWDDALRAWGVPESEWDRAWAIVPPEGEDGPRIFLQQVPEDKQVKNRVHLDVRVADREATPEVHDAQIRAEAERLEGLGATRIDWRVDMGTGFMVMADPEGNEFCLT